MITDRHVRGQAPGDEPAAPGDEPAAPGGTRAGGRHAVGRRSRWPVRLGGALVIAVVIGAIVDISVGPRPLHVGDTAAAFTLPELAHPRRSISLSDYAGRPVIINFCAAWSPPCVAETQLLAHFYRHYHQVVQILGVDAREDRGAGLALARRSVMTYPVVTDPALAVADRYGVPGLPATYFLDARHQVVETNYGWLNWKKLRKAVKAMRSGTLIDPSP
jgi:cytochrome c biogenesis protein CcmG, thiol:disulfide interchange protein DsbE